MEKSSFMVEESGKMLKGGVRVGVFGWIDRRFPEVVQCKDYEQGRILEGHKNNVAVVLREWNIRDSACICWRSVQTVKGRPNFFFFFPGPFEPHSFETIFRKFSHAVTWAVISWEFWDFLGVATLHVCYENILFMKHLKVVKSVLFLSQIYTLLLVKLLLQY